MKLTPTESDILSALTRNPSGLSRFQLIDIIRPGVKRVSRKILDVHMANLRKKLLMNPDIDMVIVHERGGPYTLVDLKNEEMPQ